LLNPKIEKRQSKIGGYGLFAKRQIKQNEIIWFPTPKTMDMIPLAKLSSLSEEKRQHWIKHAYLLDDLLYIDTDDTTFMNHSCEPNVIDDGNIMRAVRDIQKDEEITWNYIPFINPYQTFVCNCGSRNCVVVVTKNAIVKTT
jgi:hypothetical protein